MVTYISPRLFQLPMKIFVILHRDILIKLERNIGLRSFQSLITTWTLRDIGPRIFSTLLVIFKNWLRRRFIEIDNEHLPEIISVTLNIICHIAFGLHLQLVRDIGPRSFESLLITLRILILGQDNSNHRYVHLHFCQISVALKLAKNISPRSFQ
jgi:hypothetical protein